MTKKIKNLSSRGIPEELEIAIFEGTLDEANDICDEYNLRIVEIECVDNDKIYTIGDNDYAEKTINRQKDYKAEQACEDFFERLNR